jgi:alginate O-acetyltransferase complex protein AlgI
MISIQYFIFLLIGIIVYWVFPKQYYRNIWLCIISLIYLYLLDKNAPIIAVVLSIFSYIIASGIEKSENGKSIWHKSGVIVIILVLVFFKYLGFFNNIISTLITDFPKFPVNKLLFPIGISYITFKHISFLTDIYWGLTKKGNFIQFLSYSTLFPIFLAGPIERYERFLPQVEVKEQKFKKVFIEEGFERIVYGIFKKAVIADWIGYFIKDMWLGSNQNNSLIGVIALTGYSVQIYMDFSGYSDIAIGSSRLFGLKIMENFNYPYFQPNIGQFWRSWHISLSDWIRDYIFAPMSFQIAHISTNKIWTILFVPVIAMGLCGLWHGAAWHFLFWGIWHGIGLSVYQVWNNIKRKNKRLAEISDELWFNYAAIFSTFVFVTVGWLWFR